MMKRYIVLILLALLAIGVSAQKAERKAIRSGNNAYKDQLYGNAQEKYQKALEVNAASKEASFNLANTYYKQQQWDEALKEYQHYLTLENEDVLKVSTAWANVGNTYLKKKDAEGAQQQQQQGQKAPDNLQMSMESYKNALRSNPNDDEVRYNLAVVQKMLDDQQGEGGGDDNKDDKDKKDDKKDDKDKQDKEQEKQNQDKDKDKKDDKKQEEQNGMSQDNIEQILQALEQEEKETQERVNQAKAQERKRQNMHNKRQNKDW